MPRHTLFDRLHSLVRRATALPPARRPAARERPTSAGAPLPTGSPSDHPAPPRRSPGDFTGVVHPEYSPSLDGDADPGEVVWTWVPYEEDAARGKDRPVLVVGRDGEWLLGLMLTSKDHAHDAADEARYGRVWLDVGSGAWDSQRRPSEVRMDRVLRLDPSAVRREGAIMDRVAFDRVVGWLRTR